MIYNIIYIYNPLKSSEQFRCFIHVIILQFVVMVDPCTLRDPKPQVTDTVLAQMLVDLPTGLVGGLEHFPHILGIIIPTDYHIFQRGWNHQPV